MIGSIKDQKFDMSELIKGYNDSDNPSNYIKDNDRFSDNMMAIEMLKDITTIINAIEYNDKTYIKVGIKDLKEHLSNFEEIFYQNLSHDCYK